MRERPHSKGRRLHRGLIIGALMGAGAIGARKVKQKRERVRHSSALSDAISISYTKHRVPRIIAGNRNDALFGLGYAVADDRLWQLDIHRRSAYGELSAIFGEQTLPADRLMRAIGVRRIAHQLERNLDDDTRAAAEAFSAGVNHRIETGRLPFEFKALRYQPEPWTPVDCLAVYRLLAWSLGGSIDTEITGEWLRKVLGDEWTDAIYFGSYPEQPPIVRELQQEISGTPVPADRLPLFPD
ncbi:MAG: penicillin acylase family protein, partial [Chloroflexota bacterium]